MQESVITTSKCEALAQTEYGEQKGKEVTSKMMKIKGDTFEDQQMIFKYIHKKFNANKGIAKSAQSTPDSSAWFSEETEGSLSENR